jgi:endoglucanase
MVRNVGRVCAVWAVFALGMLSGRVCLAAPGAGYWHTSGSKILDSNNQQVRIAGINWYGFETTDEVVHGLTSQDYKTILDTIKANGYNTVRLPYSNQMVESPIVPTAISYYNSSNTAINSDLQGLNSLQIMDAVINYAGTIGLRIILDNHRSEAGNSAEASGLWYTAAYPETSWISDWQTLVTRYLNNTTVIGVDVRNEPHNAATGGACWDCGTLTNDWHLAAERAGNAVLTINPSLLIFVEGTDEYNNNYYFWGGNLQGVQTSPVQLNVTNQLVYSAHDYGPHESAQAWFNSSTTYSSLVSTWTSYWAYISLNNIAPVWVGEFGTLNDDGDVESTTDGSEGQWFSSLVQFLGANSSINWTYWALNGEDSYALLDSTYDAAPVSALKQQLLAGIQFPLSGGTAITTPSFTLSQNPSTVIAATSNTDLGSSGNVTQVTYAAIVNNRTSSDETGVSITLTIPSTAVLITQASSGSTGTCSSAGPAYTCNFATIPAANEGGITLTAIYPAANLTFNGNGQSSQAVSATATVSSQALPATSVTTVVDQQGQQPNTSESVVATAAPGYSYNYGQTATVNFSLVPTPTSPIPLASFSAQLDGTQSLTITSLGANSYQIPLSVLSGGAHSIVIHLAASTSYAASSATVALAVQKANVTAAVAGTPAGSYGTAIPITLDLSGLSGTGFAAPTGTVSLAVDNLAPQTASLAGGTATFTAPATLTATTHSLNFNYSGDSNYASQYLGSTLSVKQAALVATASPASRALGAANPAFTGTLTGVVTGDGITATYVSQATTTTPAGAYSTGSYAITPVLADPNNRLFNYATTLNDGTLTITNGSSTSGDITWATPAPIVYGTPLGMTQLDATASTPGTFTYTPPAGTVLGAGSQTLSVSFVPTGSSTAQSAKTTLVVNQGTTTTTLTAVNAAASMVTLSAVVASIDGGAVTGSVQFFDGSTPLSTVTINASGQATYTVTLSEGSHTLTATYSGDVNNLTSTSTAVLQTVSGSLTFTLTANPTKLSLSAGQSSAVTLSVVSAGGLSGTVSFTCTGLPTGSTCSFQPATITATGANTALSTTLTVALPTGSAKVAPPVKNGGGPFLAGIFMLPGGLLGLYLLWQRKRLQHSLGIWVLTTVFLLSVAIGCGSSTSGSGGSSVGSYNALITATSASTVQTLTIPVTLTN